MILRKAKLEDFEVFKQLYEDKEGLYQFLYNNSIENYCTTSSYGYEFDDSILEMYHNYSINQFEKDLNSSILYMIEDENQILGYISLFYCDYRKYSIAEWAMFNPGDECKKVEVLNNLKKLKLPKLRKFSICTINKEVEKFLLSNGFSSLPGCFFELEI